MSSEGRRPSGRAVLRKRYILLVLAFGGPLIAISVVQYRWLDELTQRARVIERQRNHEAAVSSMLLLKDRMSAARTNTLPAVVHAHVFDSRLEVLARQFDEALDFYPYVERFFVWAVPTPPRESLFYFPEEGRFRTALDLVDRMPPGVWGISGGTGRWAEFSGLPGDPPLQIVVHRLLDERDSSLRGLVGFTVDLDRFARNYLPEFHAKNMVPLFRDILEEENTPVVIHDQNGRQVFSNSEGADWPTPGPSVDFHVSFSTPPERAVKVADAPIWHLSVGDSHGGVDALLRRGTIGNLMVVGAGIVVLMLGTLLITRTSTREAQLSDLKSRFISGISHELKTPLSLIRLYSEMLELGRVPDEERKIFYRNLRRQAEALGDMLEQILDFSRLQAEQQVIHKESCPAREIVDEAIAMLEASFPERRVALQMDGGLPDLDCDRHSLSRAFYNLLENAAKYSPSDRPIDVQVTRYDSQLAVEIRDQGIGIASDELPHIFQRFYRAPSSEGVKGTGLGLSIADTVVKAHRGRIEVQSEPGQGSRFTVILPAGSAG